MLHNYTEENIVRSLVFYEWMANFNITGAQEIFNEISDLIGSIPDIASVADRDASKDYLYKNFVSRDVLKKRDWQSLNYLWKRNENTLSDFAIEIGCAIKEFQRFEVHIDVAAVENIGHTYESVISILTDRIQPVYGIGYEMPYFWGPRAFARGSVSSRYDIPTKSLYGAPTFAREQSLMFGPVFREMPNNRHLDVNIRDVFEVNFISDRHLDRDVNGISLKEFINKNDFGELVGLGVGGWIWRVPSKDIHNARRILIDAGITIVK